MAAMGMVMNQPWGAGDLLLTFVMWAVMMVGMMAASALPVLLLFAGVHAKRADRGVVPAVPSFGLGYLIVWLAFSACATAAQWALHEARVAVIDDGDIEHLRSPVSSSSRRARIS